MPLHPYPVKSNTDKNENDWYQRVQKFANTNEPMIPKAQVNFNGTGSPAIRNGYGITSITDNGTGDYTLNLEQTLRSTDTIVVTGTGSVTADSTSASDLINVMPSVLTTTSVRILTIRASTGAVVDPAIVNVTVRGDV